MNNKIINLKVTKEELLTIKAALMEKLHYYKELKFKNLNEDNLSQYIEIIGDLQSAIQTIKVSERFSEVENEG